MQNLSDTPNPADPSPPEAPIAGATASYSDPVDKKEPVIALLISFFVPGGGTMYAGNLGKGAIILVLYILAWVSVSFFIGIFLAPLIWLFGLWDAWQEAQKHNQSHLA